MIASEDMFLMRKQIDRLTAENERLRKALSFYEREWKSKTNKIYGGLEWSPTQTLLDDCGNTAKEALEQP